MTNNKRVRFSNYDTIEYTHSSQEYDRSPFAGASSQLYQFRNNVQQQQIFIPSPLIVYSQQHQQKKPKVGVLKINTHFSTGPLFFTGLSTNYSKFDRSSSDYK